MSDYQTILSNYERELKRGSLTLSVISFLKTPKYGYSLLELLVENGVPIDSGTLYPLLRRLEKQGILISEWSTEESRPRKYYSLSELGFQLYDELLRQWNQMVLQISEITKGDL